MREFVGIHMGRAPAGDTTTVRKFRRLLEAHALGGAILRTVNRHLARQGFKVSTGTIVDASIIAAPFSTNNHGGERDPEIHQRLKKDNEWHFGMKANIGVDSATKIIHSVVAAAANMHDSHLLPEPTHGEDTRVWGDSVYQGQGELIRACAQRARDCTHRRYRYRWLGR
jgi:IS5 family transposase